MMEHLFVYGTLLAQAENCMSGFLKANAMLAGNGFFCGKLFNTGEYPGAVLSRNPGNKVFGNIYEINNAGKVFRVLDAYEEAGPGFPEPNEFVRQKIDAFLFSTRKLICWIYLYNHPTDDLETIPSGDYAGFCNNTTE